MSQILHNFLANTDYLANLPEAAPTTKLFGMNLRDVLLLVGAALVLGNLLFLWAYLNRRSRRALASANPRAVVRAERHEADQRGWLAHARDGPHAEERDHQAYR